MFGNSPEVASSQPGPHPRLREVVLRHREHPWRAPLHAASETQFARWLARHEPGAPLALDLGCGHGDSSLLLAARHPRHCVLGVDQSAHRLARLAPGGYAWHGRVCLIRAEAATVVRLLAAAGLRVDLLYLLYPNPWPKPEHLQRRWHGHPLFPLLLATAARLRLRTNWPLYAEEFALAAGYLGRATEVRALPADAEALTPFERKYRASGHARVELTIDDA
jgi:tRNA G46 methylase TrmB